MQNNSDETERFRVPAERGALTPIDKHVGSRIRSRRETLRLRVEDLAEALGIALQQLERYEAGSSRIGAENLMQISEILQAPPSFFFEAFSASEQPTIAYADPQEGRKVVNDGLRLNKVFVNIKDASARKKIIVLAELILAKER